MNYAELWRPQYHYSTLDSQTGDPNGLLYYKGVYHLYYQCMPHQQTSRQHWGHATSTDLIHWTEQEPALLDYIDELKEAVISLIESYWANFREVGEDMMLGLAQGIRDGRSEVVNAIAAAVQAALERGRNDLGIRSPSKVFAEMGEYSMEGFALGMKNRLKAAVQTVSEGMHALASAAPAAAQPAANSYTYGDTVVYVDTVNASDPKDIERMAYQLEFYRRQIASGRGNLFS